MNQELQRQIGQLLLVGFSGSSVTEDSPIVRDIRDLHLGGVILFDRFLAANRPDNNIIDRQQLRELTATLQRHAQVPLLIAVDQEGGRVNRFKAARGFAETPPPAELGNHQNTAATAKAARQTAALLADLGINCNLAPVVDLNLFPDNPIIGRYQRSFSAEPQRVIDHAAAWIGEHRRQSVISCLKHFPGHGSARADSHLGFVDVSDCWQTAELLPFRALIQSGMADTVMTAHLFNRLLDPSFPATLSGKTVNGLLRDELGHDGVVFSDDLQMRAIANHYGLEEAACLAINAGVDILIFGNNLDYDPDIAGRVIAAISSGVASGRIARTAIEQAWQRVEQLKTRLQGAQSDQPRQTPVSGERQTDQGKDGNNH